MTAELVFLRWKIQWDVELRPLVWLLKWRSIRKWRHFNDSIFFPSSYYVVVYCRANYDWIGYLLAFGNLLSNNFLTCGELEDLITLSLTSLILFGTGMFLMVKSSILRYSHLGKAFDLMKEFERNLESVLNVVVNKNSVIYWFYLHIFSVNWLHLYFHLLIGLKKFYSPTQYNLCGPQKNLSVYIAHSNRVCPSLDLKIEICPSGTKRLPTPAIRYAPV